MNDNDTKRLSRLTAILTQLQTKRLLTATTLADKFGVSVRTIYRDIRALEQAGVPILTEEGERLYTYGRLQNTARDVYRSAGQCLNYGRTIGA